MDTPRKEFGAAVHQARLDRQVTIADVARETAVSKQAIAKIEEGLIVPRLQDFASLCRWAGLDADRWVEAFAYKVDVESAGGFRAEAALQAMAT
ncbi:helix-turn-helix domain-containing protein [Burkholderia vietnamiensis]|uniref:helix-turn-helix domain-containing protein n=1 Tax=Burkholderia vietnamiensis TaxID=60552 RepID=UPI000A706427|nr:helix-turn-helix transcriptional regulator [Burkholderia vietnamiensis]MBR8189097.1 helix-turn-helix domain-containing protein [Burkholderia vietnamiensis]HDR9174318.1 helix-turn-helix domain-containing protein [Burkholderia vietnamiensis]